MTFGFGDQLALLSTLTTATTIDGSYHTARTLPELRSSGIGQIDTAFWFPDGLSKLDPILQKAGEHGVRWGFVNVPKYVPVLERNGWIKIKTLKGGVQVWENPNAELPPPSATAACQCSGIIFLGNTSHPFADHQLITWLTSHMAMHSAEKALRAVYCIPCCLIPLGLCFWYYRTINQFPHERVYFIYTDALFFLANGLVLLAVIVWLSTKIAQSHQLRFTQLSTLFCLPPSASGVP